jgi:hypothetical protein
VIRWDTARDTFERGHWFHGRIYTRRSDLSPDGELLAYFASQFNRRTVAPDSDYTYAWTALSRPPWLTALALWPKGDCWHGGGLFLGNKRLLLNHRPERAKPHPRHRPQSLEVVSNPDAAGEDDPIYSQRLDRDGWVVRQKWQIEQRGYPEFYRTIAPEVRARSRRSGERSQTVLIERRIDGLRYRELFRTEGFAAPVVPPVDAMDWLDWDQAGRLVVLGDGRIWSAEVVKAVAKPFRELLDLRGDMPEDREAPAAARSW